MNICKKELLIRRVYLVAVHCFDCFLAFGASHFTAASQGTKGKVTQSSAKQHAQATKEVVEITHFPKYYTVSE